MTMRRGGPTQPISSLLLPFDEKGRAAAALAAARRFADPADLPPEGAPSSALPPARTHSEEVGHDARGGNAAHGTEPAASPGPADPAPNSPEDLGFPQERPWDGARCKSCRAPVIWAITPEGKKMPVDAFENPRGNVVIFRRKSDGGSVHCRVLKKDETPGAGEKLRTSHFKTCPDAQAHRRR